MLKRCERCPLLAYCITQKQGYETCNDMVLRYNAGLLIPPEFLTDTEELK